MLSFLSQKIKIKNFKTIGFVFGILFVLSFATFSFADDQNNTGKNIFQDTDQDGLSNDEEKLYGTDPNKSDTDGDGYSDGTEIKSGYNPLKPSPGDKITVISDIPETVVATQNNEIDSKKNNLTEEVSKQVANTLKESSSTQQDLSLDDLKSTVQQTINNTITLDTLPEIDTKSIKVQKQKYSNLSESDRTAKIKEDMLKYTTAVSYILMNNSPVSVRSDSDAQKLASSMMTSAVDVISGRNPALLNDLSKKGSEITKQLQGITVPENMLDMHIKALRLAQYATTLEGNIQSNNDNDPLAQLNSLAKVQGFVSLFAGFTSDMNDVLTKYDIQIHL